MLIHKKIGSTNRLIEVFEKVNKIKINENESVRQGVEYPIQMIDDNTFPNNQRLPSPDTPDASIRVNPSKWRELFIERWGDNGALVFDGNWWNVVGNEEFIDWKEGGIANKAKWLDNERAHGRTTEGEINEYYADDFSDDVRAFIKTLEEQGVDYQNASPLKMWHLFEEQYHEGSGSEEFYEIWKNLINTPNQTNMFEDNIQSTNKIRYSFNDKGIFIPIGYEDKKIGIISVEKPAYSNNNVISVVEVNDDGSMGRIYHKAGSWKEAKNALLKNIL